MNTETAKKRVSRRTFLALAGISIGAGWLAFTSWKNSIARAAPFVKPKEKWIGDHLHDFLCAIPPPAMLTLKKSLGLLGEDAPEEELKGSDEDTKEIQNRILWLSSNVLTYWFKNPATLNYHDVVVKIATKAGAPSAKVAQEPTFPLESELYRLMFIQIWDQLDQVRREELIEKLDPDGSLKDKVAIAALGGAAAITSLSATVAFSGFAFYTSMSIAISSAASVIGVTLPFATYAGASSIVGVLTGPVGWALTAITALGGIVLAGRANMQKTAVLISQLHALKVEALVAANVSVEEVF